MISRRLLLTLVAASVLFVTDCNRVPLLAPTGSTITLTALATALPANGSTTLIAQVLEQAGTPPQDGTLVIFTTTLGIVQPSQAETYGGRVSVRFLSGTQSGTATITASSGAASVAAANAVKIAVGSAAVTSIAVSANPTTLGANGGTTTIVAVARDSSGNPLPSVPISFTTDGGTLSNSLAVSDESGTAQVQLTTFVTATVTASAGTASGTTAITGTVKVTVSQGPTLTLGAITPNPATVGQPVTLAITAAAGAAGGPPIRGVTVDWGDGSSTSTGTGGSTAIHTYGRTGIFSVTVTATDVSGNSSSAQTAIQVNSAAKPVVGITATQAAAPNLTTFTFTISATAATGDSIQNNHLDFGDGSSVDFGSGTTATHKYVGGAGQQTTATVTTTTANGATGTASTVFIVP